MAVLTVTVYKIDNKFYPNGCVRSLVCGNIRSIAKNIPFTVIQSPLACDETQPAPLTVEQIELPNGQTWWVEQGAQTVRERCIAASAGGEDGESIPDIEFRVQNGAVGNVPGDGGTTFTDSRLVGVKVRVYRAGVKQSKITPLGGYIFAHNDVTGTITFTPPVTLDELIQIEIY